MIQDIKQNESNIYVRVIAESSQYSFKNQFVSIYLLGKYNVSFTSCLSEMKLNKSSHVSPTWSGAPNVTYKSGNLSFWYSQIYHQYFSYK